METFNTIIHTLLYLLAAIHIMVGVGVGASYLKITAGARKMGRKASHEKHVVPVAFGWTAVVFGEGWTQAMEADLSAPVVWSEWLLMAGLLSMLFAIIILVKEGTVRWTQHGRRTQKHKEEAMEWLQEQRRQGSL